MNYTELVHNLIATACHSAKDEKHLAFYSDTESIYEEEKLDLKDLLHGVHVVLRDQILSIKTVYSDEVFCEEDQCAICLQRIRHNTIQELSVLACEHVFHKKCCVEWFK